MNERSEIEWIRRIKTKVPDLAGSGVIRGIGDDCAIYRPRAGEELLFTTDLLIEDVHFTRQTHQARDIGHKALARGLSDIAAMGGEPRFCLLSLALAPWTDSSWVDAFYTGLLNLANRHSTTLAGGDLSHADRLIADIVVCGSVPRGKALLRSGARAGDAIWVSGRLGRPWKTHLRPRPRIEFGLALRGLATAAMDLSDGLSLDLKRLCEASGVAAELRHVPIVRGSDLQQALHGGEDYELLFTIPPGKQAPRGSIRIGSITAGPAGRVMLDGTDLPALGYDHFRK